ncbi:DeoD-type purine-nucleoside phosphorylase [Cryptosporangium phraense]|uniref:Uridine phosphorylase n=1 Tax=Cryptosporangium phraense TaxID=2593070 RepID=A0A545AFR7_9ACTN|nr:purine-nucleoside phosphorylase [Cryptosporangium phraense]TQS40186.1 purine-nucleoside phosphorylase [Cryptosporangium phraense]
MTPTPHISAGSGEFAPDMLMPGDPKRAARIAADLLTDATLVTDVRGISGFTGTIGGRPLSVMASGMGNPSISIYATELYRFYGVRRIIRVGTCGGIPEDLAVGDVVVASAAHTESTTGTVRVPGVSLSLAPSPHLLRSALTASGADVRVGPVLSTDFFYLTRPGVVDALGELGTLAIEMEAAGLYATAMAEGAEALAILTVSDHVKTRAAMSSDERERRYERMLDLAVKTLSL